MARYEHTCEDCKPLGEFKEFDLYYCPQNMGSTSIPTVIARFGENGEYYSGLVFADKIEPLGIAKARAIEAGYIKG
jgi:hypothetical protein